MIASVAFEWFPTLVRFALSCAAFMLAIAVMGGLRRPQRAPQRREPPPLSRPAAPAALRGDGEEAWS